MSENFDSERSRRLRGNPRRPADSDQTYEYEPEVDESTDNPGARRKKNRRRRSTQARSARKAPEALPAPEDSIPPEFQLPFDPWRVLEGMRRRWTWLAVGTLGAAFCAFLFGLMVIDYKVKIDLMRKETPNAFRSGQAAESFLPRELSDQTLIALMMSAEVMRRTGEKLQPPMDAGQVRSMLHMAPGATPDIVTLTVADKSDLSKMVRVGNTFAEEAVAFTRELQAQEAGKVNEYLKQKLVLMDGDVARLDAQISELSKEAGFVNYKEEAKAFIAELAGIELKLATALAEREGLEVKLESWKRDMGKITPGNLRLEAARTQLANHLASGKTELHPDVKRARQQIEQLEKEPAPANTSETITASAMTGPAYQQYIALEKDKAALDRQIKQLEQIKTTATATKQGISEKALQLALLESQRTALEATRNALRERQSETQLFVESSLGYYQPLEKIAEKDIRKRMRWFKVLALSIAGGFMGLLTAIGLVMLSEAFDTRIKTAADLQRATGLPILGTLGNLNSMTAEAQQKWAFNTLTRLRGKLTGTPDEGIVCGVISSQAGEGRSTWINLLVSAAAQRGLRVLTVDTRPGAPEPEVTAVRREAAKTRTAAAAAAVNGRHNGNGHAVGLADDDEEVDGIATAPRTATPTPESRETTPTSVLDTAGKDSEELAKSNAYAVVHVPSSGWVWSLERRKQWQNAMTQWKAMDHMILLVELPPASQPESVLLAENLPQVIWLARSGIADGQECANQLETLRAAGCNVVGAVLNDEQTTLWSRYFSRWFKRAAVIATLAGTLLHAAEADSTNRVSGTPAQGGSQKLALSASPNHRAEWQKKLTLGPGDVLDFYLMGYPELSRTNIFVAADGTISYLQARNVRAAGLTVDELRARLTEPLQPLYAGGTVVVVPVAYNSKKYYMLGKVNTKGAFTLERPITLVEAVARAKGLETGLYQRSTVELADLSRSFLMRNGQKLDISFEKLFLEGDLSQNVLIEPNDYIYFPAAGVNEIYVLGEVFNPGPLGYAPNATIITAISDRGGFTEKAYRSKVLVVRGSLEQPETFMLNVGEILSARKTDFKLQPKDIVYVSRRPWAKVEELLDEAATSFIQGAVTAWTGANIGTAFEKPLFPQIKNPPQ